MEITVGLVGVVIVTSLISGFFSQYVASARGHTSLIFFWVGFLLPIVGILVAFLTPEPTDPAHAPKSPGKAKATLTSQLDDLARLHSTGELSDDEYQTAKRRVLEGPDT